jgi:hypothetical protein
MLVACRQDNPAVTQAANTAPAAAESAPQSLAMGTGRSVTRFFITGRGGDLGAQVGHHDRIGHGPNASSWNSAHATIGCSQRNLEATGSAGLFYCFAID